MNYQENVLLIREEYVTAFDALKHWNLEGRLGDGSVVVDSLSSVGLRNDSISKAKLSSSSTFA